MKEKRFLLYALITLLALFLIWFFASYQGVRF